MWTHISSANADKEFVYTLDKIFPILYIGDNDQKPSPLEPGGGWLMARQHEIKILEDFIQNQCREMKPRGIRAALRKNLFFNTHIQFGGQEKSFKTNTKNISQNGCFVISVHEQQCGDPVWLTITDLPTRVPSPPRSGGACPGATMFIPCPEWASSSGRSVLPSGRRSPSS